MAIARNTTVSFYGHTTAIAENTTVTFNNHISYLYKSIKKKVSNQFVYLGYQNDTQNKKKVQDNTHYKP